MPKRRGIIAKGSSDRRSAFLMVATPMAESDVPATKLAVAEKHMLWTPLVLSLVLASYHAAADSLIFTRFNSSALATTIRVEPDIERAATSGLSSNPATVSYTHLTLPTNREV